MKNTKKYMFTTILVLIFCIGGFLFLHFSKENDYKILGYTQEYIDYLKLSEEEKNSINIVPDMYKVELNSFDKEYLSKLNLVAENNELPSYFNLQDIITLYTDSQGQLGLCWAYASVKSLETFLALNYGEYWNFSEGYVSYAIANFFSGYEIGNGGNWSYFIASIFGNAQNEKFGVLSEAYLSYEDVYGMKKNNKQYYQFLENYADYNYEKIVQNVDIPSNSNNLNAVKAHIIENGSLYTTVNTSAIVSGLNGYTVSNTKNYGSDHAVSIIGWDDNFSKLNFPENNRPANDGAFIALNSWGTYFGNEGIYYISYEDRQVNNTTLLGFTKKTVDEDLLIFDDVTNNTSTYDKNENMNNMFNLGDEISLSYTLKNNLDSAPNVGIRIKKNNCDLTKNFMITNQQEDKLTSISILHDNDIEAGTYIVEFTYNNEKYVKSFYVVSGAEIASIIINNGPSKLTNSINGQTKSFTVSVFTKVENSTLVKYANLSVYVNTIYCDIVEINIDGEDFLSIDALINCRYFFNNFIITKQIYDLNVITSNGYQETYKMIFIDGTAENSYNINYNVDGGKNSELNPKKFNQSSGTYSLYDPSKPNYEFGGWYVNIISPETEITELNNFYLGNVLLIAKWIEIFDSNAFLNQEYIDENNELVSKDNLIYGMHAILTADFSFLNEQNLIIKWYINTIYNQNYDSQSTINILLCPGIFNISCEATKDNELLSYQIADYVVNKRELFLNWENFDFVYNGENQQPTINVDGLINDDIYEFDYELIKNYSILTNSISIGNYHIRIKNSSNENYVINQNLESDFTINPANITFRATNIMAKFSDEILDISNCWTVEGQIYNNEFFVEVSTNAIPHTAGTYEICLNVSMNKNYNVSIVNGTYTIANGNIYTYKLTDESDLKVYVDENGEKPKIEDIYTADLFSILSVQIISSQNGNNVYEVKQISLIPIIVILLAILGIVGIAISSGLIRKNRWQRYL